MSGDIPTKCAENKDILSLPFYFLEFSLLAGERNKKKAIKSLSFWLASNPETATRQASVLTVIQSKKKNLKD